MHWTFLFEGAIMISFEHESHRRRYLTSTWSFSQNWCLFDRLLVLFVSSETFFLSSFSMKIYDLLIFVQWKGLETRQREETRLIKREISMSLWQYAWRNIFFVGLYYWHSMQKSICDFLQNRNTKCVFPIIRKCSGQNIHHLSVSVVYSRQQD